VAGAPYEKRWLTGVWGHSPYDPDLISRLLRIERGWPRFGVSRRNDRRTMAVASALAFIPDGRSRVEAQLCRANNWYQECPSNDYHQHTVQSRCGRGRMLSTNPALAVDRQT